MLCFSFLLLFISFLILSEIVATSGEENVFITLLFGGQCNFLNVFYSMDDFQFRKMVIIGLMTRYSIEASQSV